MLAVLAFWGLLLAAGVFAARAVVEPSPRWLWFAGFSSWAFSFLGSFSIGLATLVLTFIFFTLATGRALGWITRVWHAVLAAMIGIGLWFISVKLVDDYWLFYPWRGLFSFLNG